MYTDNRSCIEPRLFTNEDAAFYLGVSPGSLRLSRHTGELFKGVLTPPYLKMGRAVRYEREALDLWIEQFPTAHNTALARVRRAERGEVAEALGDDFDA